MFFSFFPSFFLILYFILLLASERSERDTYRGNTIENRGCLFICLATITRITFEIELFTALNCFAGAVKTQKLMGAPFLFELVAVVS